jgi:cell division protein FtsB
VAPRPRHSGASTRARTPTGADKARRGRPAPGAGRARRHAGRLSPEERQRHARLRALAARRRSGDRQLTFTTRAAVLALAFCAVLLTLAYPVREYFAQRSQISEAQAETSALQQQADALTKQHAQAVDPTQVENDARTRLHYTFPGQKNYQVVGPPPAPAKPAVTEQGHAKVPTDPNASWYQRLWDSDVAASK